MPCNAAARGLECRPMPEERHSPGVPPPSGVPGLRRTVTGVSLALLALLVPAVWAVFGAAAAQGLLGGGLASVFGFHMIRLGAQKVERLSGGGIKWLPSLWVLLRLSAYLLALAKGYSLDTAQARGLFGAAAGLLLAHLVTAAVGVSGLDMRTGSRSHDGRNR